MFVNPFALWTAFVLRTGEMMLASMRPPQAKGPAPTVGKLPDPEPVGKSPDPEPVPRQEPKPRLRKKAKATTKPKAAAKPKVKAKRRSKR